MCKKNFDPQDCPDHNPNNGYLTAVIELETGHVFHYEFTFESQPSKKNWIPDPHPPYFGKGLA